MTDASSGTIVIDEVRKDLIDGSVELSARIRVEAARILPSLPDRVWIRLPGSESDSLVDTADPFIPPAWLLGARYGLDVRVQGAVSARLAEGLPLAAALYADWTAATEGPRFRPPILDADGAQRDRRGDGAAAFFSGGVDSMFTVAHNLRRYPRGDSRALKGLVLVHGLDIPIANVDRFRQTATVLGETAERIGLPLLAPATNVRDLVPGLDWFSFGHGPCLASVALALSRRFHTIYIPSTNSYMQLVPCGTHPALDPHWSTEALEFVHDGAAFGRTQKTMRLASQPALLAGLRVCWKNVGTDYNCGRCEKCLRTMMTLALYGLASQARHFPPLDRAALADLRLSPPTRLFWQDIERWTRGERFDPALRAIVSDVLARPLAESPADAMGATSRPESWPVRLMVAVASRAGHTPKKFVGAVDRWLFGGRLRQRVWTADSRARARVKPTD